MFKLALRLLRQRPGTSIATLVALAGGVMILMTLAVFVESGLRYQPEPQRYAAADVVVAHRYIEVTTKEFGEVSVSKVPLPEGKVPPELADRIRAVPGVTDVEADAQAIAIKASPDAVKTIEGLAKEAGVEAYAGKERGWAEGSASIEARSLLLQVGSAFGGYVVLLIVFVVAGTVGLSVRHRRRDLALLRAVAATPRQVRALVVAEAAVVALASAAIGIPAGLWSTAWVHDQLIARGFLPESFPVTNPATAAVFGTLITLLIAVGAARIAARRVARIRPAEALGEIAVEPAHGGRIRGASGLLTLAAAGVATFFAAGTSGITAVAAALGMLYLYVIAVALLAPWINTYAARVLTPVLRRIWGVSGELAVANLRANARGMAAVLSALVLSVGFGGSVWFLQDNLERQTVTQSREGMLADRVVAAPEGLPASTADRVRGIAGVQAVTGVQHTSIVVRVFDGAEQAEARAVEPSQLASTMDLGVREGSLSSLTGDTIAVSSSAGWKVGDEAEMWLGDGTPVKRKVVAVYDRGLGFGDVVLPYVSGPYDEILVRTDGSADQALAAVGQVRTADELTGQLRRDMAISAWLNKLLITVMVAYAALAAGNTMVMAALARGRELAVLRLAGVTPRQVRRMVNAEQVGLLGAALTVGVVIAAMTLTAVVRALTGSLVPYVPPMGGVVVLGGAVVLALVTTILPVSRLLRVPPVRAAGTKE